MATATVTPSPSPQRTYGSEAVTSGVRVAVLPSYLPDKSDPEGLKQRAGRADSGRFVFGYRIRLTNESQRVVQLLSRHWIIVDADGERSEVKGEGVVGQQPVLAPGQSFEYSSFCPLQTPWGTMEGSYRLRDMTSGEAFDAVIGRFFLVSPATGGVASR